MAVLFKFPKDFCSIRRIDSMIRETYHCQRLLRPPFRALALALVVATLNLQGCRDSKFSGEGGSKAAPAPTSAPVTYGPNGSSSVPTNQENSTASSSTPVTVLDGSGLIKPDYAACSALPSAGKVKYPAKCGDNQVMAIINDGNTQEMTCCPINGTNVFSSVASEKFQQRQGKCLADEVGVGMVSASTSTIYCSKINTQYLTLGAPQTATYISSSSNIPPEQLTIAKSYNQSDTCICPNKMILIGGHVDKDNKCSDQCVEILVK